VTTAERWRAQTVEELRARRIPRAERGPGEGAVLVTVDGEVFRSISGPPREISTDVREILAGIICADAPEGSVMAHTAPSGAVRSWVKSSGVWATIDRCPSLNP
jgi:hypothetical protein